MITNYTTYAEIRSLLGVSDEEVPDEELALPIWSLLLDDKLNDLSESVATNFITLKAIPEVDRTAPQKKFLTAASLYSAYAVAQELLTALPMFSFKQVTDGRAEQERFDRWDDLKLGVQKGFSAMRLKLRLALAAVDSSYSTPLPVTSTFIVTTGLSTDPVTGA